MAVQTLLGARTTTWDRPPLTPAESLSRTATLLESARVTPSAALPLAGARADSSGFVPVQAIPAQAQVSQAPLLHLGTWSEAPQAQSLPAWRPYMVELNDSKVLGQRDLKFAPATASGPAESGTCATCATARVAAGPLLRAATMTGTPSVSTPYACQTGPQLRRTGTVTLDAGAPPIQQPYAGVILQRAHTAQPQPLQRLGSVTHAATMQRVPAPLGPVPMASGTGCSVGPGTAARLQTIMAAPKAMRPMPVPVTPVQVPMKPRPVSEEHVPEIGRLLLQSAFAVAKETRPPKQLRLVIGGLMGSGKSTICRMLRHLFEGTWINQDEFSHLGKGAKKAFLAAIKKAAGDESIPVLLVDKINTMKQHREEIVDAMNSGKPGHLVFIQVKHPADGADVQRWDHTLRLCESRIAQRGEGHRTLKAKTPQLRMILQRTVNAAEALDKDEIAKFCGILTIDMTQSSILQVMKLISDLDELDVLEHFDVDSLLGEGQLLQALEAAKKVERELAGSSAGEDKPRKEKKPRPLWYWALHLEPPSTEKLLQTWRSFEDCLKASASGIEIKEEHHVTLLYLGGGKDEEIAERHPRLQGPAQVAWLKEEFARRQGEVMNFEVPRIVWEDGRIAAAMVVLPGQLRQLCANEYPHITIGLAPRVNAVVSNELLARRAATEDLQSGLQAWLQQLSLGQYASQLASWCQNMGAATPEELAEFAMEAAEAVEDDKESQEHIAEVLQKAVRRPFHELTLQNPLQLTAILESVPKGQ